MDIVILVSKNAAGLAATWALIGGNVLCYARSIASPPLPQTACRYGSGVYTGGEEIDDNIHRWWLTRLIGVVILWLAS